MELFLNFRKWFEMKILKNSVLKFFKFITLISKNSENFPKIKWNSFYGQRSLSVRFHQRNPVVNPLFLNTYLIFKILWYPFIICRFRTWNQYYQYLYIVFSNCLQFLIQKAGKGNLSYDTTEVVVRGTMCLEVWSC